MGQAAKAAGKERREGMAQSQGWRLVVKNRVGKTLLTRRNLPKEVAMHRLERAIAAGHQAEMNPEPCRRTRQKMDYVNSHPNSRRRRAAA